MSLSAFLVLMPVLVTSPLLLHSAYEKARKVENTLVAVDNAGIKIGRELRNLLNDISRRNRSLEAMDVLQHQVQNCLTVPYCLAINAKLTAIRLTLLKASRVSSEISWQALRGLGLVELASRDVLGTIEMPVIAPFSNRFCPTCGLPLGLKESPRSALQIHIRTAVPAGEVWVSAFGRTLTEKTRWNYQLHLRQEDQRAY